MKGLTNDEEVGGFDEEKSMTCSRRTLAFLTMLPLMIWMVLLSYVRFRLWWCRWLSGDVSQVKSGLWRCY